MKLILYLHVAVHIRILKLSKVTTKFVIDNMFCGPQDCWISSYCYGRYALSIKTIVSVSFRIMKKQPEIHFETVKETKRQKSWRLWKYR